MAAYRKLIFGKLAEQQGDKQKAKASIGQLLRTAVFYMRDS